jgi:hypothetical protein
MNNISTALPELPLSEWEATKTTLHLFAQIVGKIKLALMPRKNHWWGITLHISTSGITTRSVPFNDGLDRFEINFNFLDHQLELISSNGKSGSFKLEDNLDVPSFRNKLFSLLSGAGIAAHIVEMPYDIPGITKSFDQLTEHHSYQKEYVTRFWRILRWVDGVFNEFGGRFYGKTCPVHIYWHHMDLTITRFSGKKGPKPDPSMPVSGKDSYSHEVISFGFWAGDENTPGPAFYSYTYPLPDGIEKEPIKPEKAQWAGEGSGIMAFLSYNDIRSATDPKQALLNFLESTYLAGAKRAGWDIEELDVPALNEL